MTPLWDLGSDTNVAARLGDRLMKIVGIALAVCVPALFTLHWEIILEARFPKRIAVGSRMRKSGRCNYHQ